MLIKRKKLILIYLVTLLFSKNALSTEGMPQFNSETFPSQLFWLIITFLLLYLCMNFLVLPRIRNNIRLRKNKIANDLERSELLKDQIEKIMLDYESKVLHAKNQATENTKNAFEKASHEFNLQLDTVKKRIIQKINKAENEVKEYKKNIENEVSSVSMNLSSSILEKVIGKGLSKSDIDFIKQETSKMKEI